MRRAGSIFMAVVALVLLAQFLRGGGEVAYADAAPGRMNTSHLRFTQIGLEVVIRYPLDLENSSEVDDQITRQLLDELEEAPKLQLVGSGAPNIRAVLTETPLLRSIRLEGSRWEMLKMYRLKTLELENPHERLLIGKSKI